MVPRVLCGLRQILPGMRLALVNALFLIAVAGAWAWYHIDPPQPPIRYSFEAPSKLTGWLFHAEPVSDAAIQILATTNLLNGTFSSPDGARVTVFVGTWSAENSKEMSVVSHTPDICWVGAGWVPVPKDHPDRIDLEWQGTRIPFECRTFRAPGTGHEEITIWCTLSNGQVTGETGRFLVRSDPAASRLARQAPQSRRLAGGQFLNAVRNRAAGTGDKQFVRFSTSLQGDWRTSLERLRQFGQSWLRLNTRLPDRKSLKR